MSASNISATRSLVEELRPYTVAEAAALIRKSKRDVQDKIANGILKTVEPPKHGRTPLITVASLRAYLEGYSEGVHAHE